MPRDPELFEMANGNPVTGYLLLRKEGKNIPPNWIERSTRSRMNLQKELGKLLHTGNFEAVHTLQDWELRYRKECFYYGIRVLLELERQGKTNL